jgi:hypothetical protein
MLLPIGGVDTIYADAITSAVRNELGPYQIDESRVSLTGFVGTDARIFSIGIVVDGNDSGPMLIETDNFKASLDAQMDVLRAWLGAGHPAQIVSTQNFRYSAGERVPVRDAIEPLVAVRDSQNSRVWVVSERTVNDSSAEPIPYLVFPDGSLVKEQQHGLPD